MLNRQKTSSVTTSRNRQHTVAIVDQSSASREARALLDQVIGVRAYELYLARCDAPGNAMEDWLQAEREYRDVDGPAVQLASAPTDHRHVNGAGAL